MGNQRCRSNHAGRSHAVRGVVGRAVRPCSEGAATNLRDYDVVHMGELPCAQPVHGDTQVRLGVDVSVRRSMPLQAASAGQLPTAPGLQQQFDAMPDVDASPPDLAPRRAVDLGGIFKHFSAVFDNVIVTRLKKTVSEFQKLQEERLAKLRTLAACKADLVKLARGCIPQNTKASKLGNPPAVMFDEAVADECFFQYQGRSQKRLRG